MTFRIALRALKRNKLRSFLTMLGIIIGVGAVIAMVAIGEGAKALVRSQIASLGTNVLVVIPGTLTQGGARTGFGGVRTLMDSDARAIMEEVPSVTLASPTMRQVNQVVAGNLNWSTVIQGVAPEFQQIRDWQVEDGRFINQADVGNAAKVALIGQTVASVLFGNEDPIDGVIRIKKIPFRVIGVLGAKGQTGHGTDQDDVVMIPYTTMQKRIMAITHVQSIVVSAVSAEKTQEAQQQMTALLRQRHRIQPDQDDDFFIRNLSDIAEAAQNSARVMAILLGSIASVSLLVGGIGIMNIMLVSVTERTREIGLRKAVGARRRDILSQFLAETVVVSVTGGLAGIALGWLITVLMSRFAGWTAAITVDAVLLAFLFSAGVGILFGIYPARKAAGFNPIVALRYE